MHFTKALLLVFVAIATTLIAQQPVSHLVRVNSTFHAANGAATAPSESVTFSIYSEQTGGTPLWQETQTVAVDAEGRYNALLGSTRNEGLPVDLFTASEPRWLGVQFQRPGETEQPRILLAAVPYALKAVDAETLGGRPASAYLLNPTVDNSPSTTTTQAAAPSKLQPRFSSVGTMNSIAMFTDNAGDIGNSVLYQSGGRIGLGTTTPLDLFNVTFTDTSGGVTGFAVQNLGNSGSPYSGMLFYDQNGALGQFQGFNNLTHEYRINNIAKNGSNQFNGAINFMLGSSSKFLVRPDGDIDIPQSIHKSGTLFLHSIGTQNLAAGFGALPVNTGSQNTAVGASALLSNTTASANTAVGANAMVTNSTGAGNTAIGSDVLQNNTSGASNTAIGGSAMVSNTTGVNNAVLGSSALALNSAGGNNTAVGFQSMYGVTGSNNTALGAIAGYNIGGGNNNLMLGNQAVSGDDHVTRIGDVQTKAFIAGIQGVTTGVSDAVTVMIDSNGQLGTTNSSRRFKEDIQDMGELSSGLLHLRPVTYRYKQPYDNESKPLDYGLIAEEVAEIYPDLVVTNKDGQVQTVQYQKLTPMLLNELQKQSETIRRQQLENRSLEDRVAALETVVKGMTAPK